jgi:hypothetical protein
MKWIHSEMLKSLLTMLPCHWIVNPESWLQNRSLSTAAILIMMPKQAAGGLRIAVPLPENKAPIILKKRAINAQIYCPHPLPKQHPRMGP